MLPGLLAPQSSPLLALRVLAPQASSLLALHVLAPQATRLLAQTLKDFKGAGLD